MPNEFVSRNGFISLNNSTVSGSLTVTQGITGSLFGTASWSTNALTSSFVPGYISGSGTTNYVSKFIAGGVIGPSQIFDDGTNVAIGSTSTTTATGYKWLRVNGSTGGVIELTSGDSRVLQIQSDGTSLGGKILTITSSPLILGTAGTENLRIASGGNVGIGTTSPSQKLTVLGTVGIGVGSGSNQPALTIDSAGTGAKNHTHYFRGVADGTNDSVYWDLSRGGGAYGGYDILFNSVTRFSIAGDSLSNNGDSYVNPYRNFGIGTTTPAAKLQVQGNTIISGSLNVTGSVTAASFVGNASSATTAVTTIGTNGQLYRKDDRIIEPNSIDGGYLQFGFTSWDNNNSSPYADYLHLRSYTDSSGGNDNLVAFRKNAIGMRIWQQSYNSSTAYASYRDVALVSGSTDNYVPLWTGTTQLINSAIYQSGSNIGIGTTSPEAKLDVNGALIARAQFSIINPSSQASGIAIFSNGQTINHFIIGQGYGNPTDNIAYVQNRASAALVFGTNNTERARIDSSGNVGIGTTAPGNLLTVNGNTRLVTSTTQGLFAFDAATGGSFIFSLTRGTSYQANDLNISTLSGFGVKTNRSTQATTDHDLYINSSGNTGLGTVTPAAKLHISASTGGVLEVDGAGTAGANALYVSASGNVGINTSTPTSKLVVKNSGVSGDGIKLQHSDGTVIVDIAGESDGDGYIYLKDGAGSNKILLYSNGSSYFNGGSVGIGTTSPGGKLHIKQIASEIPMILDNSNATSGSFTQYRVNASSGWEVGMAGSGDSYKWFFSYGTFSSTNSKFTITNTGDIGIGTIAPLYKLHINGSSNTEITRITDGTLSLGIKTYTPNSGGIVLMKDAENRIGLGAVAGSVLIGRNYIGNQTGTTDGLLVEGNVGIGTTSPSAKLDVNGNTVVSGSFTVVTGSAVELQVTNAGVRIGNAITDTHPVTGSLNVTGSATLAGTFTQTPFKSIVIRSLSASATQAREFEILRGITDFNDWSETGVVEIEVHEQQWGRGLKKTYSFSYGYYDTAEFKLVEMIGSPSSNTFQLRMGSKTLISGEVYYYPVYAQIRYYGIVDIVVKTRRNITTNPVSTTNGDLYVNTAPTASNIIDFTPDTTVTLSNAASTIDVTGSFAVSSTITAPTITANTALNANGNSATFNTTNTYVNSSNVVLGNDSTDVVGVAGNTMYFPGNGRVGIGTTTPQRLLDVYNQSTSGIVASFGAQISNTNFSGISFGYVEAANTQYRKSALVFERTETQGGGSNASGKIHFLLNNNGASSATALTDAVVTIDSVGTTVGSVRMGIGTRFPTASLHISGSVSTDNLMRVQSSTGAEYFFISGSGNVGIGTTSPSNKLDVFGNIGMGGTSVYNWSITTANDFNWGYRVYNSGSLYYTDVVGGWSDGNNRGFRVIKKLGASESTLMFVNSDGNVGIGQTSPQRPLHITTANGVASQIQLGQTSQRDYYIGVPASQTYFDIYDASAGSSRFVISSAGNVGIGTTSPNSDLQIGSTSTSGNRILTITDSGYGIRLAGGGGLSNNYIQSLGTTIPLYFLAGNSNDANYIFSSTGNMGIGTTSPAAKLQVQGNTIISGSLNVTGSVTAPSFVGTASWANNATSSSYALTASYALTSAGGGGSSFPYSGNALISGSLTLTGSLSMHSGSIDIKPYNSGGVILTGDASELSNSANYIHPQIRLRDYRTGITFVNNTEVHLISNAKAVAAIKTVSAIPRFILASDTQLQWSSAETNGFTLDTGIRRLSAGVLEVTSSIVAQSFTGSLQGTASWAVSASWAPSAGGSAPTAVTFNRVTASYTFALTDAGKTVEVSGSTNTTYNLTVPPASTTNFADGTFIDVVLYGTGSIQFVTGSGVTFRSANNWTKLGTRYGAATLINIAGDEWYLIGNLNA